MDLRVWSVWDVMNTSKICVLIYHSMHNKYKYLLFKHVLFGHYFIITNKKKRRPAFLES